MNKILKTYKVRIHTLSPINIGDGEEFSPLAFWIDEKKKTLNEFVLSNLIDNMNAEQKESLYSICKNASINSLSQIYKIIDDIKPVPYRTISIPAGLIKSYQQSKNNVSKLGQDLNQFKIKRTVTNINTHKPYIPGSSIKGAIKTAFENYNQNINIGKFQEDTFSLLKVSDFLLENNGETEIVYALRIGKKENKKTGKKSKIPNNIEVIKTNSTFVGSISINIYDKSLPKTKIESVGKLLRYLNSFYYHILQDNNNCIEEPTFQEIENKKNQIKNKTFLCRLGSYIGANSHTYENNNRIPIFFIKQRITKNLSYPTTYLRYDSSNNENAVGSLGWCLLELIDCEKNKDIELKNPNKSPFKF